MSRRHGAPDPHQARSPSQRRPPRRPSGRPCAFRSATWWSRGMIAPGTWLFDRQRRVSAMVGPDGTIECGRHPRLDPQGRRDAAERAKLQRLDVLAFRAGRRAAAVGYAADGGLGDRMTTLAPDASGLRRRGRPVHQFGDFPPRIGHHAHGCRTCSVSMPPWGLSVPQDFPGVIRRAYPQASSPDLPYPVLPPALVLSGSAYPPLPADEAVPLVEWPHPRRRRRADGTQTNRCVERETVHSARTDATAGGRPPERISRGAVVQSVAQPVVAAQCRGPAALRCTAGGR